MDSRLFHCDKFFFKRRLKLPVADVFQISELSIVKGGEVEEHEQVCDEITYAISGKATFYSGDDSVQLSSGQIHYIKKGMKHKIVADEEKNFRYICIGFLPKKDYSDIASFVTEIENEDWMVIADDGNVRILSELLVNEIYSTDSDSNNMMNLYISQILIFLARLMKGMKNHKKVNKTTTNFTIYHVLRYIDKEYLTIESIKEVAERLSYSEYYLSHLFKDKLGMSMKDYILNKKLTEAAKLLETSGMTVTEVSEYLNFNNLHTFSQAFKRYFSVSPSEYKKEKDRKF